MDQERIPCREMREQIESSALPQSADEHFSLSLHSFGSSHDRPIIAVDDISNESIDSEIPLKLYSCGGDSLINLVGKIVVNLGFRNRDLSSRKYVCMQGFLTDKQG